MVDLTPALIVNTLSDIGKQLSDTAERIEQLDAQHVAAKAAYRTGYAASFLTAQGSNDIRRYTAEQNTADQYMAVEVAEQTLRAAREQLRVLRDRLEIGRSLGAVMRLEWSGQ